MIRSSYVFIRIFFLLLLFCVLMSPVMADPPLPPQDHGSNANEPTGGAGAPVGDGVLLLLAFSAAYGARKVYIAQEEDNES